MNRLVLYTLLLISTSILRAETSPKSATSPAPRHPCADDFSVDGFDFHIAQGPFKPQSDSFAPLYRCPDWFRDAKFGIYMHWGLNSVPGFDGHYARRMYLQGNPTYDFHVAQFGHPSEFGYKDFISLWKAEKFDPEELAEFYKECGAKFIGVMAVHHDNFDLWDSTHQPWNSVKMGPKRDIVGEWEKATRKLGLRFFVTTHLSNQHHEHLFYRGTADAKGPLAGVPYDTMDPEYEGLYGKRTPDREWLINPDFAQSWFLRLKDLIDKYNPDLLYLDGFLANRAYGLNMAAHYYNRRIQINGQQDALLAMKSRGPKGFILDIESSGVEAIEPEPFLVDTTLNPGWFFMGEKALGTEATGDDAGMGRKTKRAQDADALRMTAGQIIDNLADLVSKNGNMMLNVGLRADGSLPETFRRELTEIGEWLRSNGEAVYGTRPFQVFGEGPFQKPKEHAYDDNLFVFTAKDIRFTTKEANIYAIFLDWPGDGAKAKITSIKRGMLPAIQSVQMLTTGERLEWTLGAEGLEIALPEKAPGKFAFVVKIETSKPQ
jgi:alpha-L-fucosidase